VLGTRRHRTTAAALLLAALAALAIAGCGGGGSSISSGRTVNSTGLETETKEAVAAKVEKACVELNAHSIWLPEYQQKTHKSLEEVTAVMREADDEFRGELETLEPPLELLGAIEDIEKGNTRHGTKPAAVKAQLRKTAVDYEEIGATDCAKAIDAGIKTIDGTAVKQAYEEEGLSLPPRPSGW
jgi:hypothetical protein